MILLLDLPPKISNIFITVCSPHSHWYVDCYYPPLHPDYCIYYLIPNIVHLHIHTFIMASHLLLFLFSSIALSIHHKEFPFLYTSELRTSNILHSLDSINECLCIFLMISHNFQFFYNIQPLIISTLDLSTESNKLFKRNDKLFHINPIWHNRIQANWLCPY